MSLRSLLSLTCGLIVAASFAAAADDKPSTPPDAQAIQQMFMKLAQPGPEHERLAHMVGDWTCECRSFEGGADKPTISPAQASFSMILGGRFLEQKFKGEFHGQPFEGRGVTGYDNGQKSYVGTWMDSFSTAILQTKGVYDENHNRMTETGSMQTPLGPMKMKMVSEFRSADEFLFTMYMVTDAGEQKNMEIVYKRKP